MKLGKSSGKELSCGHSLHQCWLVSSFLASGNPQIVNDRVKPVCTIKGFLNKDPWYAPDILPIKVFLSQGFREAGSKSRCLHWVGGRTWGGQGMVGDSKAMAWVPRCMYFVVKTLLLCSPQQLSGFFPLFPEQI